MPADMDLFLNETAFTQAPAASVTEFSPAELSRALAFHRTIPGYAPTPLTALDRLAAHFGVRSIHVKDESQRFGLKAFKALGGAYAMARHIAERLGQDISELPSAEVPSGRSPTRVTNCSSAVMCSPTATSICGNARLIDRAATRSRSGSSKAETCGARFGHSRRSATKLLLRS